MLHVIASGGMYGIERMLQALLPALQAQSCKVALACLNDAGTPGGEVGEVLSRLGVPVFYPGLTGRFSVSGLYRLHRTISRCRPRILHLHGYKATILAGALGLARRLATVATYHTQVSLVQATKGELSRYVGMENRVIRHLRGIAAVSEPIKRELEGRGVPADRIRVVANGIPDIDDPHGSRSKVVRPAGIEPLLFTAGRLVDGKNLELLIEVVGRLRSRFPEIGLLIAGEGPLRAQLERQVESEGLRGRVVFLGHVDDVPDYLSVCDCFVLPSRLEGMPMSLLEAMSGGVPIVASAVGSIPTVVRHDSEGILVQPDSVPELTAALERMLSEESLRDRCARKARAKFLREYTAESMASRYVEFYEWAVRRHR